MVAFKQETSDTSDTSRATLATPGWVIWRLNIAKYFLPVINMRLNINSTAFTAFCTCNLQKCQETVLTKLTKPPL